MNDDFDDDACCLCTPFQWTVCRRHGVKPQSTQTSPDFAVKLRTRGLTRASTAPGAIRITPSLPSIGPSPPKSTTNKKKINTGHVSLRSRPSQEISPSIEQRQHSKVSRIMTMAEVYVVKNPSYLEYPPSLYLSLPSLSSSSSSETQKQLEQSRVITTLTIITIPNCSQAIFISSHPKIQFCLSINQSQNRVNQLIGPLSKHQVQLVAIQRESSKNINVGTLTPIAEYQTSSSAHETIIIEPEEELGKLIITCQ
jgi:hypothetical protein